jgi:hypothetical protein
VDGAQFVIVRFGGGEEQLVSTLELMSATQSSKYIADPEIEFEEEVVAEVEDSTTPDIEFAVFDRSSELLGEEEHESEVCEEEADTAEETEK